MESRAKCCHTEQVQDIICGISAADLKQFEAKDSGDWVMFLGRLKMDSIKRLCLLKSKGLQVGRLHPPGRCRSSINDLALRDCNWHAQDRFWKDRTCTHPAHNEQESIKLSFVSQHRCTAAFDQLPQHSTGLYVQYSKACNSYCAGTNLQSQC